MKPVVIKQSDAPEFLAGDETSIREILHPDKNHIPIKYSLAVASLKPGKSSLSHSLNSSEVYFITKGKGEADIDGEKFPLSVGDCLWIPPGAIQYIENTGTEDLVFLCIVHPEWRAEEEFIL